MIPLDSFTFICTVMMYTEKCFTLKERGFEEVGCKLTDSKMRTKIPPMTDVTERAQGSRSAKSRSQKTTHRPNNVDSIPAGKQLSLYENFHHLSALFCLQIHFPQFPLSAFSPPLPYPLSPVNEQMHWCSSQLPLIWSLWIELL
jgi:hypothetical protein